MKLLARIDRDAAKQLGRLLKMKTRAGYGHESVSTENFKQAKRSLNVLVDKAIALA